ncbi:MAG TPA: carboxypeptidase-like regulatory domain-containing protein [Verrucomicrobiae bacterium]|nr:carboxypeptidase-like regulatory domain-containing protein [Verrucomicrobiae bacterium]
MRRRILCSFSCRILGAVASVLIWGAIQVTAQTGASYRVSGRVIDGITSSGISNVEVQLYYVPLASKTNDLTTFVATNADVNGHYEFDGLPGELEGHLRVLQLPVGYVTPLKETVRLSKLNPTDQVIFRAGPAATLAGNISVTNGTAALTNFTVEVNDMVVDVAADGTFIIPELSVYQQTARLIYQDGQYFDERVVSLPLMTTRHTNTVQILWHQPMHKLTSGGILKDANRNVLAGALIQFLGQTTGVFVGMKTDGNGKYAIYDLPADRYAVRAFVGRWGIEQRTLSTADSILSVGNKAATTSMH